MGQAGSKSLFTVAALVLGGCCDHRVVLTRHYTVLYMRFAHALERLIIAEDLYRKLLDSEQWLLRHDPAWRHTMWLPASRAHPTKLYSTISFACLL
jgi:hypothetical protein